MLASEGYPGDYVKGKVITGTEAYIGSEDTAIFQAGTVVENGELKTSGRRVLAVTGIAAKAFRG